MPLQAKNPSARRWHQLAEQIEETIAHCDAATQENERAAATIKELLSAGDARRSDSSNAPAR